MIEIDPGVSAIVASGYSNDDIMANCSEYGFRAGMCKPFTPDQLRRAIKSALEDRSFHPEP